MRLTVHPRFALSASTEVLLPWDKLMCRLAKLAARRANATTDFANVQNGGLWLIKNLANAPTGAEPNTISN
jgi:hypothetical protein